VSRLEVLKGVEGQREHFDNLGLHIGYVYGDADIPASASLFTPSYRAGARLPHAWLVAAPDATSPHLPHVPALDNTYVSELSAASLSQKQYSTLDLCAPGAFTLICADASHAHHWGPLVAEVHSLLPAKARQSLKINTAVLGHDFELVKGARRNEWVMGLQLEHGGAVVVRPDQHILNCYGKDTGAREVLQGLMSHLGL
jgi:hypothetical protein